MKYSLQARNCLLKWIGNNSAISCEPQSHSSLTIGYDAGEEQLKNMTCRIWPYPSKK